MTFKNTLRKPNENTMFLLPTTVKELELTIKELHDKKATSPNGMPSKIIKNNKDLLPKPLCDLINLVFVSGTFPQQLKTAKINPIYKREILWTGLYKLSPYFSLIKSRKANRKINSF